MWSKPGELKHLSTLRKRKKFEALSSGERKGLSPNHTVCKSAVVASVGLWTSQSVCIADDDVKVDSGMCLESPTIEGNSPLHEIDGDSGECSRVPRDTWNPGGSWEDHLPRLNTTWRPIVNQYREGKVKSTPDRGVK